MYLYNVKIKKSEIEGKGVFSLEKIKKDSIVWKFDSKHDVVMSKEDFDDSSLKKKREVEKTGYLSTISNNWIIPPKNDPALFTNHSSSENNLVVEYDPQISSEPFFIAKRDILKGEELLVNYLEFDEFIKEVRPEWV